LQLTDVRDGRLYLDDRVVLLAEQVRQKLSTWLDYRARRYPRTADPHLFIHYKTAPHTGPVRKWWIGKKLGLSAKSIREDGILDEAHATDGDTRRVSDLFGLSVTQAGRYTATVDPPASPNSSVTAKSSRTPIPITGPNLGSRPASVGSCRGRREETAVRVHRSCAGAASDMGPNQQRSARTRRLRGPVRRDRLQSQRLAVLRHRSQLGTS
jgi:hypothetical protein